MSAQMTNPMGEYLLKLQLIIRNSEFKNKEEADKYETVESKLNGTQYVMAINKTDTFESYQYPDYQVYDLLLEEGIEEDRIMMMLKNPIMIPMNIRKQLLEEAREAYIASYKEPNKYYVNLTGNPFEGDKNTPADEVLTIPDEFYNKYQFDSILVRTQPIHTLPLKYQELFINSEFYQPMMKEHPDAVYLRYIGNNAIPIEVSRPARDGDIMKINTSKLSTYHEVFGNVSVEANVVHAFSNIYRKTRDYIYQTLRGNFSEIYPNYNSLIRFLTIYMSIGAAMNEFQRKSAKLIYMNGVTAHNLFMLYGLPSVIMEGTPMIEFLKKFRLLLMDKGTNCVYRVKDLIGYENTDIYTLVMVKQQRFNNGYPEYDKDGNPVSDIVFRRMGTTADDTSYFKFRESKKEYSLDEITSGDPRWWGYNGNDGTTEEILREMNYTLSNSKYIQLSTHMSMDDIWWQCVIFLRGLLDRKQETKTTLLNINRNINGSATMTLYDAVLSLIIMMNWQLVDAYGNTMKGNMYLPDVGKYQCIDMLFNGLDATGAPNPLKEGGPYLIASFNFDVREKNTNAYMAIKEYEYLGERFWNMIENVLNLSDTNTGEMLMKDIKLIYKYLEQKVRESRTIHEFRQATEAYKTLFLVDPIRNWYDEIDTSTDDLLCEKYSIQQVELEQLKTFYPVEGTLDENNEPVKPDFTLEYNDKTYDIWLSKVLNENVYEIEYDDGDYPFRDSLFIGEFDAKILIGKNERDQAVKESTMSNTIKENYKRIIIDKVNIDIGTSVNGPTTFENLLMVENPTLYEYLVQQKAVGSNEIISMLRVIIKALEAYTNTPLAAIECKALGSTEYLNILKEVITYFKSYMVEFTKDEFTLIFGGLLDNGGNSDMLKLFDEFTSGAFVVSPKDSTTLYDVSCADVVFSIGDDDSVGLIRDEVLFRLRTAYKNIKTKPYDIWYDDGKRITMRPSFDIDDDDEVMANVVSDGNTYKIIINVENVVSKYPPGYYGNAL